jgi:hypothetical protein
MWTRSDIFLDVLRYCESLLGSFTARYSNGKIRFQSFFMLMTVQPSFFASS